MFSEKEFEDILVQYPDLIEPNLKLIGRQVRYFGKRIDILFEDKFKEKLIIELKKDNLTRDALSQVLEYEGYILSEKDPTARVMLIANRIPLNLKKAMEHHGIEYKEFTEKFLIEFIEKNDNNFTQNNEPEKKQIKINIEEFNTEFSEVTEDELLQSILFFRNRIKNELIYKGSKDFAFPGGDRVKGECYETQTIYGLLSITSVPYDSKFNKYIHFIKLNQFSNSNSSDLEINIPIMHDSRVGTLIAKNEKTKFLCNRGKCTVYMKALRKLEVLNYFESKYNNVISIKENGKITPVIQFAEIESKTLFEQIALFTHQMKIYKEQFRES